MDVASVVAGGTVPPAGTGGPTTKSAGEFYALLGDVLRDLGLISDAGVEGEPEMGGAEKPEGSDTSEELGCPFLSVPAQELVPLTGKKSPETAAVAPEDNLGRSQPSPTVPPPWARNPGSNPGAVGEGVSATEVAETVSGAVDTDGVPPSPQSAVALPAGLRREVHAVPVGVNPNGPTRPVRALGEPAARARAERIWGFWLRQASAAGQASGEAATRRGTVPADAPLLGQEVASTAARSAGQGLSPRVPHIRPPLREDESSAGETVPEPTVPAGGEVTARRDMDGPQEGAGPERGGAAPPARQVAHAVHVAVSRGGNRVTVKLEPEHLGRVEVVLSRETGGMAAHLRVENPQAHQALAAQVPVLREALEARGVSLVHVQVDLDDGSRSGQSAGGEAGRRRRRGLSRQGEGEVAQNRAAGGERWRPWGFETLI